MHIWVDADACPAEVKQIIFRTAKKREVNVTLVANQPIAIPASKYVNFVQVSAGMNEADRRIVEMAQPNDLGVTADVPLAADLVEKGVIALNPRGHLYTRDSIAEQLGVRDLLDQMRSAGHETRGPNAYNDKDKQAFANQLDRWLTKAQNIAKRASSSDNS